MKKSARHLEPGEQPVTLVESKRDGATKLMFYVLVPLIVVGVMLSGALGAFGFGLLAGVVMLIVADRRDPQRRIDDGTIAGRIELGDQQIVVTDRRLLFFARRWLADSAVPSASIALDDVAQVVRHGSFLRNDSVELRFSDGSGWPCEVHQSQDLDVLVDAVARAQG